MKVAKIIATVLLLLSVARFIFMEGIDSIVFWLRLELEGFSSWEANQAHYMAHPLSLVFTLTQVALPVTLVLALFGARRATLIAMALEAYFPFYLVYGTFCHPHGFAPPLLVWLVVFTCVALVELALWWSYRSSERTG